MVFNGYAIGHYGTVMGEIIFNTSMSGYQEIITDPSYANQIIAFSYPHIGNTGINFEDDESSKIWIKGIVLNHCHSQPSNWRAKKSLAAHLTQEKIVGIEGIDTRKLITHIRNKGVLKACILSDTLDVDKGHQLLKSKSTHYDLTKLVSTKEPYEWSCPTLSTKHVVVYDFGIKKNILRMIANKGCRLTIVPADTAYHKILALQPDGIFLSNGPGDPANCTTSINNIANLMQHTIPIFGICLGHQLLAIAAGAKTYKMKFGHHGSNHPVLDVKTKNIFITSQNHGYAVEATSLPDSFVPTHISLFDKSLQGMKHISKPFFSVQGHPEASPGPHDMTFLFDNFISLMNDFAYAKTS
jgi:carbamoyl-phosphate synthase small subunit